MSELTIVPYIHTYKSTYVQFEMKKNVAKSVPFINRIHKILGQNCVKFFDIFEIIYGNYSQATLVNMRSSDLRLENVAHVGLE